MAETYYDVTTMDRSFFVGAWEFWVTQSSRGCFVSVPDCGGMADSVPRVPEQLAWAEEHFAKLAWLKQTWPTSWELPAERMTDLEAFFKSSTLP